MQENWRPIVGYEGLYDISDIGRVNRVGGWTDGRKIAIRGIRSLKITKSGYARVTLCRDKTKKEFPVSLLVLAAFVGPKPSPVHQGNHKNGKRADNRLENLEYCTPSENQRHAYKELGRKSSQQGSKSWNAKITEADVPEIRRLRSTGMLLKDIATKFGISVPTICWICKEKAWTHIRL
jgi:hypothetical protein